MAEEQKYMYISTVAPAMRTVNIQFIVLDVGDAKRTKDGQDVRTVRVADQTGSLDLGVWNQLGDCLRPGDICRLKNGYANIRNSCLQVTCGRMGELQKIGEFCMTYSELPNMSAFNSELTKPSTPPPGEDGGNGDGGGGSKDNSSKPPRPSPAPPSTSSSTPGSNTPKSFNASQPPARRNSALPPEGEQEETSSPIVPWTGAQQNPARYEPYAKQNNTMQSRGANRSRGEWRGPRGGWFRPPFRARPLLRGPQPQAPAPRLW